MRTDPETQEGAVLQALIVRATEGQAQVSIRRLAQAVGLSRQKVTRITDRLLATGQLIRVTPSDGTSAPIWQIPSGHKVAHKVAQQTRMDDGNAVPTMPFNYPPPSGVVGSWFEQVYRSLTRKYSDAASGRISVSCRKCADTGYYLEKVSEEYSRDWLKTCSCEAGQWKVIPDSGEYIPQSEIAICQMCENTGWVTVPSIKIGEGTYSQVQRCRSCNRTWS